MITILFRFAVKFMQMLSHRSRFLESCPASLAKKRESTIIFRLIKDIDPNAFVSQSQVIGVYGEGFDKIKVK